MKVPRTLLILLVLVNALAMAFAKKPDPDLVMFWPNADKPTLKLTFAKFEQIGSYLGQMNLSTTVTVENMTSNPIPRASFTVYLLDKQSVRVGDCVLRVNDLGPHQSAKMSLQVSSVGLPATISLSARNDTSGVPTSLKTIALKVIATPRTVNLTIGPHNLEFKKEGYAVSSTPVEVSADDLPGGSISVELGGLSRDTLELRDGTVLLGDAISLSMTSVVMRVDGKDQAYPRNQVKKIMLVERETVQQPAVVQPAPTTPQ